MPATTCIYFIYEPLALICRDIAFDQQVDGESRYADMVILTRLNQLLDEHIDLIRLGEQELLECGWSALGEDECHSNETAAIVWAARMVENLFNPRYLPLIEAIHVYAVTGDLIIKLGASNGRKE